MDEAAERRPEVVNLLERILEEQQTAGKADYGVPHQIEQLMQLFNGVTWDGNLLSESARNELVKNKLAVRAEGGYNLITPRGVKYLHRLGIVRP